MITRKITRKAKATSGKKKTTAKKATAKRPVAKKAAKSSMNRNAIRKTWTKSEILAGISDCTGLTKKDVSAVFCELEAVIAQHLKSGGSGEFTIPRLMKIVTKRKPAVKARKGVNPFTGEPTTFKARPARTIVKVRPLKNLKDMV